MRRGRPPYPGPLTPREWQVLRLIEEGLTNEQIAERLGISFAGARYHVAEIISKLGVSSRMEAVAVAREQEQATTGRGRWAGLALPALRLHLGSPVGVAGVGVAVALVLGAVLALVLHSEGRGDMPPPIGALEVDGGSVEEFIRAIRSEPLQAGDILYIRTEVFERHGPKTHELAAASGIPLERYVRESWQVVGEDGTLDRAYAMVLDDANQPVQASVTINGSSRTFDPRTGRTLWDMPLEGAPIPTRQSELAPLLEELALGNLTVVDQNARHVSLEVLQDDAYFNRTILQDPRMPAERKRQAIDSILQRFDGAGQLGLPYFADLEAVALKVTYAIHEYGLRLTQRFAINPDNELILVSSYETTHFEVVDAIPAEVIALTQIP